ncbi:hypothetical protein [Clostridium sp.]|uniref:hypothetical protein n=1 Tax=Clostridium sp. TaxID=1506 RepID=UPI001A4A773F|nr:hypothetical protein [Clostridium sp.]MBK5242134.1 hypothetical protein [Clostridium sp.]
MVKKVIIEKDDEGKMLKWDEERLKIFREKYNIMDSEEGVEYVIGLDIASTDSPDVSVMCQFRLVDGKYIYEGVEEI